MTAYPSQSLRGLFNRLGAVLFSAAVGLTLAGCGNGDPQAMMQQAKSAAASGQWSTARKLAERIADRDDTHIEARILHGISLYELREPEEAEEVLAAAAEDAPDNFAALYFHGWLLFEMERYADALQPLKQAYEIRKDQPDLLILLSACCLEQNLQEGLRYLQALRRFRTYRNDPEVYNDMALLWLGKPDVQRAQTFLLRAHSKAPQNPTVLLNLAVLYDRYLQDFRQAVRYYRMSLEEFQRVHDYENEARIQKRLRQLARQRPGRIDLDNS